MSTFKTMFKFECQRFMGKRNLVIFGVLAIVVIVVTQFNVKLYERKIDQKKTMIEFEEKRVQHFIDYRFYGNYGFRISIKNEPLDIWSFSSAPFPDIQADVDTSERLKIYSPLQGASAFSIKIKWLLDFSGMMLLYGGILAFLFGFETFHNKKFLEFLGSLEADGRVFFLLVLSRVILLILFLFTITVFSYLVVAVNGIAIPLTWRLPVLFLSAIANALFFFGLGILFGQFKKMWVGILAGSIIFIVSIFYLPAVLDMIIMKQANDITAIYKIELEKMKIQCDFEKRSIQKKGQLPYGQEPSDAHRDLAVSFFKNEFERILEHDQDMIDQMAENVSLFRKLAMFLPITNYLSTTYDLNTHGYKSLLKFYREVKDIKRAFMNFFIDVVFFKKITKVEQFLKSDDILLKYESQFTWEMPAGLVISLIFFLALVAGARQRFKKSLYRLPEKDRSIMEEDIDLKRGGVTPVDASDDRFAQQVYCLFSGGGSEFAKKGYTHRIRMDNKDLKDNTERLDFLYLSYINTFPRDIKAGSLLDLAMGLAKTGKEKREEIRTGSDILPLLKTKIGNIPSHMLPHLFLAFLDIKKFEHYIISDICPWIPPEHLLKVRDRVLKLANEDGASVLIVTAYPLYNGPMIGKKGYFNKNILFFSLLESLEIELSKHSDRDKEGKATDGGE